MRRITDMYPCAAKTEKDAFIIADAAGAMPHTSRGILVSDEDEDEDETTLGMSIGFDLDLSR